MEKIIRLGRIVFMGVLLFSILSLVSATDTSNIQDTFKTASNAVENIPRTPEEIKDQYLKQAWTEVILGNKYLGPVHTYFLAHQTVFLILFNQAYTLSLRFLGLIFLWLFFFLTIQVLLSAIIEKNIYSALVAIILTPVVAQTGIINLVHSSLVKLLAAQSSWASKLILFIMIAGAVVVVYSLEKMINREVISKKKVAKTRADERAILEAREEARAAKRTVNEFMKGLDENTD